jgi:hypothetical protein
MGDLEPDRRLPLRFDPARLKADLALIHADEWVPHYNERDYGGEWRGAALRSLSGSSDQLAAHDADPAAFANTALHRRCTYFRDVLSEFRCPLKSVRLLSLAPNSFVREHSDPGFGTDGDEVRIHVPIRTSADVEFYLDGERLHLEEGCCYYIDVSRPHRVTNRGDTDRIHLVVDAEMNDWLRTLLRHGAAIDRLPSSPTRYEEFCSLIVNDVELSRELAAISDWDGLIDDVVRRGRRHGFVFDAGDVRPRKERVLAHQRPASDWLPAAVHGRDAKPTVEWAYFGSRRLTEPFFEDSLRAVRRNPFARLFQHETRLPSSDSGPPPAGFIFHTSRCGSTLIAQMLAALPRALVISEAAPIDDVIQAGRKIPGLSPAEHAGWLRAIVTALGQRRDGEDLYVVKLDAWHVHNLPLVRAAFPETPWIFLYRDPVDVLISQLHRPGRLCLPGAMDPAALGLQFDDVTRLPRGEWCARVLQRICQAALTHQHDPKGLLLNYRRLPDAVWGALAAHFSIAFAPDDIVRMRDAARFDAKSPSYLFHAHAEPRDELPAAVRTLAARRLAPLYAELERQAHQAVETA